MDANPVENNKNTNHSFMGWSVFGCALIVLITGITSGFGSWFGWWEFRTGFTLLRWAVYGSLILVPFALFVLYQSGLQPGLKRRLGSISLVLAVGFAAIPLSWYWTARTVPPIHDITTDLSNPPAFKAIVPLREDAPNPTPYPGEKVAEQQKQAYPELQPLKISRSISEVFPLAQDTAKNRGWKIVESNPEQGRIEAVDTTFWFGFKDDLVIRLTEANGQTHVDVRSKSRVGKSDAGTNARRIRRYLNQLEQQLQANPDLTQPKNT